MYGQSVPLFGGMWLREPNLICACTTKEEGGITENEIFQHSPETSELSAAVTFASALFSKTK